MKRLNINIEHLTRVEGHGNIVIDLENEVIKKIHLEIIESPRFFEAMLKGRDYTEAANITSRICGICSIGHTTASLRASENALGIEVSGQTKLLRRILLHGEFIQSHILHLYFLVAPDFFGLDDVTPLVKTNPEVVKIALNLKKLGNTIAAVIGGRHINPISPVVGGFSDVPSIENLENLLNEIKKNEDGLLKTIDVFKGLKMPEFENKMNFICLGNNENIYPLYEGDIICSNGDRFKPDEYNEKIEEFCVKHSNAKHTNYKGAPYMVGALARVNMNFNKLHKKALSAANELGFQPINYNPFYNNIAQLIETVHCFYESMDLIESILNSKIKDELPIKPRKNGRGVGAVEVPRGLLFHDYSYNENYKIINANCIIPTGQNLAKIDDDMKKFLPCVIREKEEEIKLKYEMLARAYDPCISCSVHLLDVKFI